MILKDPHLTGLWWAAGLLGVAALVWLLRPPVGAARVRGCAWAACRAAILLGLAGFSLGVFVLTVKFRILVPLVVLVFVALAIRARRWRGRGYAHGTARLAAVPDLAGAGMLSGYGLILGRVLSSGRRGARRRAINVLVRFPYSRSREACLEFVAAFGRPGGAGQLIRLPTHTHVLTVAPTGAGKGVSYVVPALLTYRGSVIIFDPNGELYKLTSARRRAMGQKVRRLDFFGVCGPGGDTLNVLDLVQPDSPLLVDDARAMAEVFVARTGDEKDPHWNDSAVAVLTAILSLILTSFPAKERNLGSLREVVTDPELFAGAIARLCEAGGLLRRLGNQLKHYQGDELMSVLSTTDRHTTFIDSRAVEAGLKTSSFDVRGLLRGDTTVYLILPADQIQAQSRLLRLVVSSLIRLIGREGAKGGRETLVLLDEAAQLGNLEALEQALCLLRHAGLRLWLFYQSVEQAKQAFKGKESIIFDNTDTQIYFGVNSLETAQKVSAMLGEQTITNESHQDSTSRSSSLTGAQWTRQTQSGSNRSYAEQARAILKPEEVLQLPKAHALVFTKGAPPILVRRVRYFADPAFRRWAEFWLLAAAWRMAVLWRLMGAMAVAAVLGGMGNAR